MTPATTSLPAERGGYITGQAERFARCVLLTMKGTTVSPTIEPGQAFLVDETATGYMAPGLYLLDEGFGPVVKRVEAFGVSGVLRVTWSGFRESESYEREAVKMAFLGRVVGVIVDC